MSFSLLAEEFRSVADGVKEAVAWRRNLRKGIVPTGMAFLDDCFHGGIFRRDLVLLGAQTGRGKTQAATLIAKSAALGGRRVTFFALEAEQNEIEARLLFNEMRPSGLTPGEYMSGISSAEVERLEDEAAEKLSKLEGFQIYYRSQNFDADKFTNRMLAIQGKTDLVIVDHFHFLDHAETETEARAHQSAIKAIRETQLSCNIPVLLLAQLNKAHAKSADTIPTHYDFYGTSSLPNICTKAFTITGRMPDGFDIRTSAEHSPTVFYASKNRTDGSVANYFAVAGFSHATGSYSASYRLYDFTSKDFLTKSDPRFPGWARRASVGPCA